MEDVTKLVLLWRGHDFLKIHHQHFKTTLFLFYKTTTCAEQFAGGTNVAYYENFVKE